MKSRYPLNITIKQLSAPAGDALPCYDISIDRILSDRNGCTQSELWRDAHLQRGENERCEPVWLLDIFEEETGAAPICDTIRIGYTDNDTVPFTEVIHTIIKAKS